MAKLNCLCACYIHEASVAVLCQEPTPDVCRAQFAMRSPKNTLEVSGDLTVKEPVDNVESRLSQTVALLVVAEMMSGLMVVEFCCGLKDR